MSLPQDDRPVRGKRRLQLLTCGTIAGIILAITVLFVAWMLWGSYLIGWLPGQNTSQYEVTIENHSSQAVVVSVLGLNVPMRPCSVRRELPLTGPRFDGPLHVEVKDTQGHILATWQLPVSKTFWEYTYKPHIRFPETGEGECAPDNRKEYMIVIRNQSKQDVDVTVNGLHLGVVPGRGGEQCFGPIPGDWAVEPKLILRNRSGRTLVYPLDYSENEYPVDYDLGQTPVREVIIFDGW